jgi:hypothetical protein
MVAWSSRSNLVMTDKPLRHDLEMANDHPAHGHGRHTWEVSININDEARVVAPVPVTTGDVELVRCRDVRGHHFLIAR